MSERSYQVKDVATVAGVTVRTLHHYDQMGLLSPSARSAAGYRLYSEDDLLRLQQVLLWRELGLPLEKIGRILDDGGFDRHAALIEQRQALRGRAHRIKAMIGSIDAALEELKGEQEMDTSKIFNGFDPDRYEGEVRERWGDTEAYAESARRTRRYSEADWKRIQTENGDLLDEIAALKRQGGDPAGDEAIVLAERHRQHIDRWFYPCSRQMHAGLAGMYVADARFTTTFDRHGEGLAGYLAAAIRANLESG